jgi:putative DNA primase/helicase
MSGDTLAEFAAALAARDIIVPRDLIADGRLHRCDAAGRHGKNDAAYLLHLDDFPAGGFENHRDGRGWEPWCAKIKREFSAAERAEHQRRMAEARAQRDADDRQRKEAARERAGAIWRAASLHCDDYPYFEQKHISAHGARLWRDRLVIPVLDLDGTLHSLQFIDQRGGKRFLTDGRVAGCCYPIGPLVDGEVIAVAEGFATATTINAATGFPAVATFHAGNLAAVARAVRERYPASKIILAADDDHRTEGNPGLTTAREAAALVRGVVAVPKFGADRPDQFTDFNDLGFFAGHDRVREIIDAALAGGPLPADSEAIGNDYVKHDQLDRGLDAVSDGRPTILVRAGLRHEAVDAGLAALHAAGVVLYQRDRNIVRVTKLPAKSATGDTTFTPGIVDVGHAYLSRELGCAARWTRLGAKGKLVQIDPPRDVVDQIADMAGEWPFSALAGVIGTPTMRPDGSLLLAEGYDSDTWLVLLGAPPMPPIPDQPTRAQTLEALQLLDGLLEEFPFRDGDRHENSVDRSVVLSMIMTVVLRGAMPVAPMHHADAPQPGTGKSFLADIASEIATGQRCAVIAFSPSPEESEKRLNGAALAGYPIIALDNCTGTIEGQLLCQITERPLLQLRRLGSSDQIRVTNSFTVLSNGNNATVGEDNVRRTIVSHLDANMEMPETRVFNADPLALIRRDRGAYVAACLTIARAYLCAGKPERLPPLASYEAWSDLVRSPLVWLGRADPVASMASLRLADPKRQARAAVFKAWADELGTAGRYLTSN